MAQHQPPDQAVASVSKKLAVGFAVPLFTGLVFAGEPRTARPHLAAGFVALPASDFQAPESDSEVDASEYRAVADSPYFSVGNLGLAVGLDYQYTRFEYDGIEGRNRDLHRLQFPIFFNTELDHWELKGFAAPGLSTSSNVMKDLLDEASGDDLIFTGRVEGLRNKRGGNPWLVGLAWDRAFGDDKLYPVLGAIWKPAEDVDLRLAFPDPELIFQPSNRQVWSLRLFPAGHRWHVESEELDDDFDYELEAWRLAGVWSVRLWKDIWIDLGLGYEFARHHEFIDDTGRLIDADVDDQWLLGLGLRAGDGSLPWTNQIVY